MITIDYSSEDQCAVIAADPDCPPLAWAEVRRVCEERAQVAQNTSSTSIILPWWSFLAFRGDMGYVLNKVQRLHGVQWNPTPAAATLLQLAKDRESAYKHTATASPPKIEDIAQRLKDSGFTRELKSYQIENVRHMLSLPASASFSVPGAGKTTEALALYFLRRRDGDRLIVVAPKNAFAVWEEQIEECAPGSCLRVARLQGGASGVSESLESNPDVGIITYQQLPRALKPVAEYLAQNPCFLFLDESHRMKAGLEGVSASAILSIAHLPISKLILTGTPMPNSPGDLTAQFAFLYPEVRVSETTVVDQLQPIYVRTTKGQLGLEPVRRVSNEIELSAAQARLYSALSDDVARRIMGLDAYDRIAFRAFSKCVMHLIQAASDPSLLASGDLAGHPLLTDALADPSPKILEATRIARRLANEGQKCVLWSYFVKTVEHLAHRLADLGAEYIHGGVDTTPDESITDSREAKIRRFHDDPSCKVLVANPAACSESISLHRVCHHAIYVDRTYNAAQYLQSEDRIHRLGLGPSDHTYVMILVAKNTIDESVNRRLQAKVAAMGRFLDDPHLDIRPFDLSDESDGLDGEDIEDLRRLLLGGR